VIGQLLFNHIAVTVPFIYLSYPLLKWRGLPPLRELPAFHWVLIEMVILLLVEEIGFYYSHRYL
jgi:methylsterol monooxygenase